MKLDEYFGYIEDAICAGSQAGSTASHSTVVGNAREALLRDFLSKTLGKSYVIGQGVILSSQGELDIPEEESNASGKPGQYDIVIYDARFPLLSFTDHDKGFFVEGVRAWIEVKSQLNKADVLKAEARAKLINDSLSSAGLIPAYLMSLGGNRTLTTVMADLGDARNLTACSILNKWVVWHEDLTPISLEDETTNPNPQPGNYRGFSRNAFSLIMLNLFTKLLVDVPQGIWFRQYFEEMVFAEETNLGDPDEHSDI